MEIRQTTTMTVSSLQLIKKEGRKEMFYLTTHSTHFIYSYMMSRHMVIIQKEYSMYWQQWVSSLTLLSGPLPYV